jgi:hypothetical protein
MAAGYERVYSGLAGCGPGGTETMPRLRPGRHGNDAPPTVLTNQYPRADPDRTAPFSLFGNGPAEHRLLAAAFRRNADLAKVQVMHHGQKHGDGQDGRSW